MPQREDQANLFLLVDVGPAGRPVARCCCCVVFVWFVVSVTTADDHLELCGSAPRLLQQRGGAPGAQCVFST